MPDRRTEQTGFTQILEQAQDRVDVHTALVLRGMVREEITEAIKAHALTAEEREWLSLAMRREARREKVHQAIVEKSLAGLVWAGVVGLGVVFYEYIKAHGWKP